MIRGKEAGCNAAGALMGFGKAWKVQQTPGNHTLPAANDMALEIISLILPDDDEIARLKALLGSISVGHRPLLPGAVAPSRVDLVAADGTCACVRLNCHPIAKKFDCFEMRVSACRPEEELGICEVARLRAIERVECLFRFEWVRPASPNEVPAGYEPVKGERGQRARLPADALTAAVSMVGLAVHASHDRPALLMIANDESPATIKISGDASEAARLMSDCETVALSDYDRWKADLSSWIRQRKLSTGK